VADGFQIYLHSFVVTAAGDWAVVQQGMNEASGLARRYHWHSASVRDFVCEPHTAVVGEHQGVIMNLVDRRAAPAQTAILGIVRDAPERTLAEARRLGFPRFGRGALWGERSARAGLRAPLLKLQRLPNRLAEGQPQDGVLPHENLRGTVLVAPRHHDVRAADVDLKRLGAVLAVAYEREFRDFASLLLLENLGPRTLQSLALVAEVVHGAPARFSDPARFSFAHGGKDGHPFPVPLKTYDESIAVLRRSLDAAKLGGTEKTEGLRRLDRFVRAIETHCRPEAHFDALMQHEHAISPLLGGRTVLDDPVPAPKQLSLFYD
jgi:hypothetical protein